MLVLASAVVMLAQSGKADYLLTLNLSPDVYTVTAGGQITLSGFFTTSDALTFTYDQDFLFGLSATSPYLGAVAGSVLSSQDFQRLLYGPSPELDRVSAIRQYVRLSNSLHRNPLG